MSLSTATIGDSEELPAVALAASNACYLRTQSTVAIALIIEKGPPLVGRSDVDAFEKDLVDSGISCGHAVPFQVI